MRHLTFEQFKTEFKPVPVSYVVGGLWDYIHETDDLLELRQRYGDAHVWTLQCEGTDNWINNGCHYVNRVGYIVTERDWREALEVDLPDDEDSDAD